MPIIFAESSFLADAFVLGIVAVIVAVVIYKLLKVKKSACKGGTGCVGCSHQEECARPDALLKEYVKMRQEGKVKLKTPENFENKRS